MPKIDGKEFVLGKLNELEEHELLEIYLEHLRSKKKLTEIPVTLFEYNISPAGLIIKYLKENLGFGIQKIAKLLKRNPGAILNSYNHANKKYPEGIFTKETNIKIPLQILSNRSYSILENITVYLHEVKEFRIKDIAKLLCKNSKTISTVYRRARQKRGERW